MATLLSPAVRRLVLEHGLDLAVVGGSGPRGRVLKGDLLAFLKAGPSSTASPQMQTGSRRYRRRGEADGSTHIDLPFTGPGAALLGSRVPLCHGSVECEVAIETLTQAYPGVTLADVAARAAAMTARRFPKLRSGIVEATGDTLDGGVVHVGVRDTTGATTVVPEADRLSVEQISEVRKGTSLASTATVKVILIDGVRRFTTVLDGTGLPGQAAVLGIGERYHSYVSSDVLATKFVTTLTADARVMGADEVAETLDYFSKTLRHAHVLM